MDEIQNNREVRQGAEAELEELEDQPAITTPPVSPKYSPPSLKEVKEIKDIFSDAIGNTFLIHNRDMGKFTFEEFETVKLHRENKKEKERLIQIEEDDTKEKEDVCEEYVNKKSIEVHLSKESENRRLESLEKNNILLNERIESNRTDKLKGRIDKLEEDNKELREICIKMNKEISKLKAKIKEI